MIPGSLNFPASSATALNLDEFKRNKKFSIYVNISVSIKKKRITHICNQNQIQYQQ
jgi:ribosomal protein S18